MAKVAFVPTNIAKRKYIIKRDVNTKFYFFRLPYSFFFNFVFCMLNEKDKNIKKVTVKK